VKRDSSPTCATIVTAETNAIPRNAWSVIPAASDVIAIVSKRLEQLYRESDAEGRNRIETGALEHVLEAPRLRPYFEHWAQDGELREAYEPALAWGRAHSDDAG